MFFGKYIQITVHNLDVFADAPSRGQELKFLVEQHTQHAGDGRPLTGAGIEIGPSA